MKTANQNLRRFLGVYSVLATALVVAGPSAAAAPDDDVGLYLSGDIGPNFMRDPTIRPGGGILSMNPGLRVDGAVGYNLNSWAAVELESGFLYNSTAHDANDSWLGQMPVLGNVVVRYQTASPWTPYAGLGLGGVLGFLDNNLGSDTSTVFAWQFKIGVRYRLKDNLSVDAGYKYLGTADQHYNIGGPVALTDIHNHMLGVSLNWKF